MKSGQVPGVGCLLVFAAICRTGKCSKRAPKLILAVVALTTSSFAGLASAFADDSKIAVDLASLSGEELRHAKCGLAFAAKSSWDNAAREFRDCPHHEKYTDSCLLKMAWSCFNAGKNELTVSILDALIGRYDKSDSKMKAPSKDLEQALDWRSYCNLYLGKYDECSADCRRLLSLDIDFKKRIYDRVAVLFTREKKYADAIKTYDAIAAKYGFDRQTKFARGGCLQKMGRYSEAISEYTSILKPMHLSSLGPREFTEATFAGGVLAERAKCYDKLGKNDLALADRKQLKYLSHSFSDELFPE